MEEEFYKFVTPAEIAKDLNLPKELATKIHKYWALKRKVLLLSRVYFFVRCRLVIILIKQNFWVYQAQDDIPLLPPTLQQQEKLSGKQVRNKEIYLKLY